MRGCFAQLMRTRSSNAHPAFWQTHAGSVVATPATIEKRSLNFIIFEHRGQAFISPGCGREGERRS